MHTLRPLLLRTAVIVALAILIAGPAFGQDGVAAPDDSAPAAPAALRVPPRFASPRAVLSGYLDAMGRADREAAGEYLDLSRVPDASAGDIADRLFGLINRIEFVRFDAHPAASDLANDTRYRDLREYVFFPRAGMRRHEYLAGEAGDEGRIVITRGDDGRWLFSAQTAEEVWDLYDRLSDIPVLAGLVDVRDRNLSLRIESEIAAYAPALVQKRFLSVKYWQWAGLFAVITIGVVLDFLVRGFLAVFSRVVIRRQGGTAAATTLRRTVRPFGIAAAGIFWLWTVELLGLPGPVLKFLLPAVKLYAMLAMVWAAYRLTDLLGEVLQGKAASTETKFDDLLVPLVRKTVKVFITAFGVIYIADSFDVDIAPLLTGLGIGGVGFAFAAKDTIENFFGSVTVIVDRPFQVGDWVTIGDTEGTVEELGLRSVRIRTFYNSLVTIPTANLVRAAVDNYGKRKYRRWTTHLNVTYDTPPERIEAFCEGVRELIRLHPYTRKDYYQVWMHGFGPSSLDILVYLFHECPDWQTELRERHRLILDVIRLADRLGVDFAFPTQTLHVHTESGEAPPQADEAPTSGSDFRAQRDGRRAVHELTSEAPWRTRKPGPYRFRGAGAGDDDDDDTQIESKVGGDA